MLNFWDASWGLDERLCPCDVYFAEYLEEKGVKGASIFHFGEFTIRQAKDHMARAGLPMRLDP